MRRVWSIANLTFREALHNKVLLSCAFFAVVLVLLRLAVFAVGGRDVWINVEQFTRLALLLILMTGVVVTIVVVSPSLSQDIKSKVIHTVIPKPIHRVEILLGKVLGFMGMAGLILLVVGLLTFALLRLTVRGGAEGGARRLLAAEVKVPASSIRYSGGCLTYLKRSSRLWLNPLVKPEDQLKPAPGEPELPEIKVIPGEAVVSLGRIRRQDLGGQPLRFELRLGVHRFGGAAGRDPELSVVILNRETGERRIQGRRDPYDTERGPFIVRENVPRRIEVPADFVGDGATVDLIIHNLTPKHRVGIERTDVTLLLADRSYTANFVKSLFILFLETGLVVVVAVMSSTFLSGLIAILFTAMVWVGGHLLGYMAELLTGWARTGRGPLVEVTHELQPGQFTPAGPLDWLLDFSNSIFNGVLTVAAHLFPNLSQFDSAWLLAGNVDITGSVVWQAVRFSLLYSAVCFVIAYACFRVKEVAR